MKRTLLLPLVLVALALPAQRLTVVIDPARGGSEYGARIGEHTYEKQVTLDLANRLRPLLTARDFDVVFTRESDTIVTNDQRAAVANGNKAVACLSLHSTGSGTGLHLFTSSLTPAAPSTTAVLWDEAQAPFVQRSERLLGDLASAFSRAKLPVSSGHTWIRPLDNMQCPALAIEVGPESGRTDAGDHGYQARIADVIASTLLAWRNHGDIVQSIVGPPREAAAPASSTPAKSAASAASAATPSAKPTESNAATTTRKPALEAKPSPAGTPATTPSAAPGDSTTKPPARRTPAPAKAAPTAAVPDGTEARPQ